MKSIRDLNLTRSFSFSANENVGFCRTVQDSIVNTLGRSLNIFIDAQFEHANAHLPRRCLNYSNLAILIYNELLISI